MRLTNKNVIFMRYREYNALESIVSCCRDKKLRRCVRSITEGSNKSQELRLKNFFPPKEPRRLGNESSFSSLFPDEKKLRVGNKYKLQDYRDFSR